jgi:hypothetical protein
MVVSPEEEGNQGILPRSIVIEKGASKFARNREPKETNLCRKSHADPDFCGHPLKRGSRFDYIHDHCRSLDQVRPRPMAITWPFVAVDFIEPARLVAEIRFPIENTLANAVSIGIFGGFTASSVGWRSSIGRAPVL